MRAISGLKIADEPGVAFLHIFASSTAAVSLQGRIGTAEQSL